VLQIRAGHVGPRDLAPAELSWRSTADDDRREGVTNELTLRNEETPMGDGDDVITLPEITIVGNTDSPPRNASEWWGEGFVTGYNDPDVIPDRPMLLDDELTLSFFTGVEAGRETRRAVQAQFDEQLRGMPQIGPDLGGESFEEVERRYREAWEEVFHQHPPHTEVEVEPGETPTMPPIRIVE
jgi:hypothetical protein